MKKEEFMELNKFEPDELITAESLTNQADRTLIYGYTCERDTFHVYLKEGEIHTIVYNGENVRVIDVCVNRQYLPDKRIYAYACDYEFCRKLKEAGCTLFFTAENYENSGYWKRSEELQKGQYYARTL